MGYHRERHRRRSIRLKNYDYSKSGAYFITICTYDRRCLLGKIRGGGVQLSTIGKIAKGCWFEIPNHFNNVILDCCAVMPNHIHGILFLSGKTNANVGVQYIEPLRKIRKNVASRRINRYQRVIPQSIGSIIRCYKAAVTRWCHREGHSFFRWQRNYYEHVIRNERDLNEIRKYILNNPLKWHLVKDNRRI